MPAHRLPGASSLANRRAQARVRAERGSERGNSLLLALIVMSALATLGSLTVVSVQSSLKTSTNDRSQEIALYAAESGAAAAMQFLRGAFDPAAGWSAYLVASNNGALPLSTANLPSNGALPGMPGNPFSADQNAWYSVTLLNNRSDPGYTGAVAPLDADGRVIIRATGHGPQGSLAILEWEVQRVGYPASSTSVPLWSGAPITQGVVLVSWHIVSL